VNEIDFVKHLRRYSSLIGDDCAVVHPPAGRDLLFTTDFTIEGVHFKRSTKAEHVGRQALARSLSDIAAMGGEPLYCLVAIALAPWTDQPWIDGFYHGLNRSRGTCKLAGGDLSHARQLVCNVTVCGAAARGQALLRSGARPGDRIFVSGKLGGWKHRKSIVPRLDIGRKLAGKASACIDITDGLAIDLFRICSASGVAAEIESIPLLEGATFKQALHDGEDYELLYTVPPGRRVPGKRIGYILDGPPGRVMFRGKLVPPLGYDHFQNRS
jgi:thiamine-monophosphate kinase